VLFTDWALDTDLAGWLSTTPVWLQLPYKLIFMIAVAAWLLGGVVWLVAAGIAGYREPKRPRPRRRKR
jgi:hypothetical protein